MKLNSSPLRILAIDPGFDRLGVAILDKINNKENLVYSTCIITNRKDSFEDRLFSLGESLEKIIKKHKPDHLAIETLFYDKSKNCYGGS